MKKISLLGATGSVGRQTLEVISDHPDQFSLVSMSFGKNVSSGLDIIHRFQPGLVSVGSKQIRDEIITKVPSGVRVVYGQEGLIEAAVYQESNIVLNALLGSVGLAPTLAAIEAGKNLAFANKETLVTAGHLVMKAAEENGVQVLPVDSEHSAIFQCLQGENRKEISRLIITASGGSFRDKSREELEGVTVEEALKHPNWSMGAKITIDSATMMNKGLEVIEAHWLFGMPYEQIDVLLHRESVIHSMVEFADTSVIAQLGLPDMRVPIQYALSYPNRLELKGAKGLNLWEMESLHFQEKDLERFRCLEFAFEAGKTGGTMPTVLNAANEEAVGLFLNGDITFLSIEDQVEAALRRHSPISHPNLQEIQEVDRETREFVRSKGMES
ncbi:MAG TPA: 1-deoxy-D-xylulose-5-phosphate reductoisomerase [Bacillales bacterium]